MRRFIPANPRSNADIESLTLRMVRRYQPQVLTQNQRFDTEEFFDVDLEQITGVTPDYQHLDPGIYGYTDTDKNVCIISRDLVEDPFSEFYCRSTTAHEMGHAVLHVPDYKIKRAILRSIHKKGHDNLRFYREDDIPLYVNPEWQAWRFAGALLMPAPAFKAAVRAGETVRDLSRHFGVNPSFIQTRGRALKLILKD